MKVTITQSQNNEASKYLAMHRVAKAQTECKKCTPLCLNIPYSYMK